MYVTELDVNLMNVKGSPQNRYLKQAQIYKKITEACFESEVCKGIVTWGVGDSNSWLELLDIPSISSLDADPTLFYDDLSQKPSYYAVLQALYQHVSSQ